MEKTLAPKGSAVRLVRRLMLLALIGLMAVPAAASASTANRTTANTASAAAASSYALADLGCDRGAIHAFARIKGTAADFPSIYTTSSSFVDISYNCTGGAVSVRRASTGVYLVRFAGSLSRLAIAQNNADGSDPESIHNDNILTVAQVTDTDGGLSFRVEVQDVCGDCSAGTDPQNGRFVLMVI